MRIFASARVVVLDSDTVRRTALCDALAELGLQQLLPVSTAGEAGLLAKAAPVDLCVVHAAGLSALEPGGVLAVPPNPFDAARTPAILILTDPNRQAVNTAYESGYRLVMLAPVAPRLLYRRIGSILQKVRRAERAMAAELAAAAPAGSARIQPD